MLVPLPSHTRPVKGQFESMSRDRASNFNETRVPDSSKTYFIHLQLETRFHHVKAAGSHKIPRTRLRGVAADSRGPHHDVRRLVEGVRQFAASSRGSVTGEPVCAGYSMSSVHR